VAAGHARRNGEADLHALHASKRVRLKKILGIKTPTTGPSRPGIRQCDEAFLKKLQLGIYIEGSKKKMSGTNTGTQQNQADLGLDSDHKIGLHWQDATSLEKAIDRN